MRYLIDGQKPLSGTVSVSGAKNAALKLIIAALMCKGVSRIRNVPRIKDIESLLEIINFLGGSAKFASRHTVVVENRLKRFDLPLEAAAKVRVSIMLIAPLLFQFGRVIIPNPGGCRLGERAVDRLIDSLRQMGADIVYHSDDGCYHGFLKKPHSANVSFLKKSHTGTELAIMFAAKIKGKSVINNAAKEPEINDLIAFLNRAGASIKRVNDQIIINGNPELLAADLNIQPDRIEAVTFIVLAALFKGRIKIKGVPLENIKPFLKPFSQAGFTYLYEPKEQLFSVKVPPEILPTSITTAPHPGFLTDWQPLWTILMTQAKGISTVHETVFENRLEYVESLKRFGAKIDFYQPKVDNPQTLYQFNNYNPVKHCRQAIKITGPTLFHNAVAKMTDIRAGACLVLAALIAKGKSAIDGVEQIERGYENLVGKLTALGAKIKEL